MPLCDQMCRECGTLDGVSYVMKICDKCSERNEMKITKEMLGEIVRIESLDENEWDAATVEFEKHYGVTTAEVGIEMIRAYAELPEKLRGMKRVDNFPVEIWADDALKHYNQAIDDIIKKIENE